MRGVCLTARASVNPMCLFFATNLHTVSRFPWKAEVETHHSVLDYAPLRNVLPTPQSMLVLSFEKTLSCRAPARHVEFTS